MTITSRITWIDTAKAMGIWLVFYGHFIESGIHTETPELFSPALLAIYKVVYAFHMPFFFILAGFFFRRKNDLRFGQYFISRIKCRLIPVLFFVSAALPFFYFHDFWNMGPFIAWDVSQAQLIFLVQGRALLNDPCWFLICLFVIELFVFELIPFLNTHLKHMIAMATLFVAGIWMGQDPEKTAQVFGWVIPNWWTIPQATFAASLYLLGYNAFQRGFPISIDNIYTWRRPIAAVSVAGLLITCYLPGTTIVNMQSAYYGTAWLFIGPALFGALSMISIAMILPVSKLVDYVGQNTLPLLGLNGFFLHFFNRNIYQFMPHSPESPVMLVTMTVVASTLSIVACLPFLYVFNRYLPWLIGKWK